MKMGADVVSVHVRIDPELRARIGMFAEVANVSVNAAIAEALEEAFGGVPLPEGTYRDAVLGARGAVTSLKGKAGEDDD